MKKDTAMFMQRAVSFFIKQRNFLGFEKIA